MTIQDQNKLRAEKKDWRNMICTCCEKNTISNPMNIAFAYEYTECEECFMTPLHLK